MLLDPSSWAHAFPMVRAGGVFIFIMGVGVVLGALFPSKRRLLLIVGAAIASIAIALCAASLSAPLGIPTKLQIGFLLASIVAEAILVRVAVAMYRESGERSLLLAILVAVGLHFLPMAVAFGPQCAALGMTLCACAGVGLWLRPGIPLNRLWATDGFLKMAFGASMFRPMSFAVDYYLVFVGILDNILLLALPFAAILSIRRRRRNRPGANTIFQYLVIAGWAGVVLLYVRWLLIGSWYGENGNDPGTVLLATALLVALVALHVALVTSSSTRNIAKVI